MQKWILRSSGRRMGRGSPGGGRSHRVCEIPDRDSSSLAIQSHEIPVEQTAMVQETHWEADNGKTALVPTSLRTRVHEKDRIATPGRTLDAKRAHRTGRRDCHIVTNKKTKQEANSFGFETRPPKGRTTEQALLTLAKGGLSHTRFCSQTRSFLLSLGVATAYPVSIHGKVAWVGSLRRSMGGAVVLLSIQRLVVDHDTASIT